MGEDGGRLSKRTGAVAVSDYKKMGFVPEGLINYLMLLGWSPGPNQEIVNLEKAIQNFSIKKINKTAAIFSIEKLKWVNAQHLKKMDVSNLTEMVLPFLKEKSYIADIVNLFKGRISTLKDFVDWADFAFIDNINITDEDRKKFLSLEKKPQFDLLAERFLSLSDFNVESSEKVFRAVVEELKIKAADLVHPVRVALTGKTIGPGLFETMAIIGKEKTVKRLQDVFAVK